MSKALLLFAKGRYYDKKELSKGTFNFIPNLPRDIVNKRTPCLFCHNGSIACRNASSRMITLSNTTSQYWDNFAQIGPSDTANRDQHPLGAVFPPCYQVPSFQINRFGSAGANNCDYKSGLAHPNWVVRCSYLTLQNFAEAIKHGIQV